MRCEKTTMLETSTVFVEFLFVIDYYAWPQFEKTVVRDTKHHHGQIETIWLTRLGNFSAVAS